MYSHPPRSRRDATVVGELRTEVGQQGGTPDIPNPFKADLTPPHHTPHLWTAPNCIPVADPHTSHSTRRSALNVWLRTTSAHWAEGDTLSEATQTAEDSILEVKPCHVEFCALRSTIMDSKTKERSRSSGGKRASPTRPRLPFGGLA